MILNTVTRRASPWSNRFDRSKPTVSHFCDTNVASSAFRLSPTSSLQSPLSVSRERNPVSASRSINPYVFFSTTGTSMPWNPAVTFTVSS